MAEAVEKRYLELGGQINYNARVDKILVENGKAVGIRLEDGLKNERIWSSLRLMVGQPFSICWMVNMWTKK